MLGLVKLALAPMVAVLIGVGGVSFAMTGDVNPLEGDDSAIVDDTTVDDGTVDDGTVDDGTVDDGTVDDGTVDDGTVDDGTVDDGTVDDGTVDDGTVDDGTVDDGTGEDEVVEEETDPCEGFTGNHGQYVSGSDARPRRDAAHSSCGMPATSNKGKTKHAA